MVFDDNVAYHFNTIETSRHCIEGEDELANVQHDEDARP